MQLLPAIDIKGGHVARYDAGDGRTTIYAADPVAQAEAFIAQGALWVHVVDLDRAYATGGNNDILIQRIARIPGARVQLGGSLASPDDVARGHTLGVTRVVVSTAALLDPPGLEQMIKAAGSTALAAAVDVRDGRVALRGDARNVAEPFAALATRAVAAGIRTIVYRDLGRDGSLGGADIAAAGQLVGRGADVLIAGGAAGLEDIRAARRAGLAGVIVGRALYEGRFTLAQALACLR